MRLVLFLKVDQVENKYLDVQYIENMTPLLLTHKVNVENNLAVQCKNVL